MPADWHDYPPFAPPGGAQRALIISLGANAVMAWVVLVGLYTFFERIWRGLGGHFAGQSLAAHWAQVEAARRLQGLAWVVTAVLFLIWIHRVYGNLAALGVGRLRFSPRLALATFFIPLVNLLWPLLVIREVWEASQPGSAAAPGSTARTPAWLAWWWALFVATTMIDPGPWRLVEDTGERFAMGGPSLLVMLAQLGEVAAAVLAIVAVRRVDAWQQARAMALRAT
jgi:hypothetical protein